MKRLTPSQVWATIATLFLVLGYVEKIRDASSWLVGPPRIETSIQSSPIDVMVGEPFKFEIMARNTRPVGDSLVEFLEQSTDQPSGLELDPLALRSVPGVKPDSKATLPVSGKALKEGTYKIRVKGRATAGYFASEKSFEALADVRVWPRLALGDRRIKNYPPPGTLCEAEFELRPGVRFPSGIEVEAKLERLPHVRFVVVRFPGTNLFTPRYASTPGKEVATLEWRTPELSAMRPVAFTVLFESVAKGGHTIDQWEVVVQRVQFAFGEAR